MREILIISFSELGFRAKFEDRFSSGSTWEIKNYDRY